jgi:hypothetical protein
MTGLAALVTAGALVLGTAGSSAIANGARSVGAQVGHAATTIGGTNP